MNFVCMISQSTYPSDPRVRRQAEVLEKAGYEVDLICLRQKTHTPVQKYGAVTAYRIMNDQRNESIAKYMVRSLGFFVKVFFKLRQLNKIRKYDLIQIHNMPEFHVFTAFLNKIAGVPVVLDIHDLTPELFESKWNHKINKIFLPVIKFAEKISCRFSDKIITVTDACKELLIKRGVPSEKITLILNTPDEHIIKFDPSREYKTINSGLKLIYHGTIAERFGIHDAIEALSHINKKIPNSTFTVYGKYDDSYKAKLYRQISELGLKNNVILEKRYLLEDIYLFIKKSDIGVVPYVNNPYMNIALSTKTFEYAAAGLPVVSTRLKTLAALLDDNAITYCEADNPKDMAEKIIWMCQNPDILKMRAMNARKAISGIAWPVMAQRYLNLIDSAIAERKSIHRVDFDPKEKRLKDYTKVL